MSRRSKRLINDIGVFVKKYTRKAQKGVEPNDRSYDRKLEHEIKHMKPEELSKLLSGDGDGLSQKLEAKWISGENLEFLNFQMGDTVRISTGLYQGEKGCILSLLEVEPEVRYYIELESGVCISILQPQAKKL